MRGERGFTRMGKGALRIGKKKNREKGGGDRMGNPTNPNSVWSFYQTMGGGERIWGPENVEKEGGKTI